METPSTFEMGYEVPAEVTLERLASAPSSLTKDTKQLLYSI